MAFGDAVAALISAGLTPDPIKEARRAGTPISDADYTVMSQRTVPGMSTICGSAITIVAAYRPGAVHVVQEGDTYQSIAEAEGISVEKLLGFSGLTVLELENSGQTPSSPLALGQAIRLSHITASEDSVPTT